MVQETRRSMARQFCLCQTRLNSVQQSWRWQADARAAPQMAKVDAPRMPKPRGLASPSRFPTSRGEQDEKWHENVGGGEHQGMEARIARRRDRQGEPSHGFPPIPGPPPLGFTGRRGRFLRRRQLARNPNNPDDRHQHPADSLHDRPPWPSDGVANRGPTAPWAAAGRRKWFGCEDLRPVTAGRAPAG
jgi:hypothetical protein